jgi:hypothetical protein
MSLEAEMSAAIAAAAALEPAYDDSPATEPAAVDDTSDGLPEDVQSEVLEPDEQDDNADDEDGEDDAESVDVDRAAIAQKFVDGDVTGACKALGIDPKILNINVPKYEAMRKGLKEAKALKTAADAKEVAAAAKEARSEAILVSGRKQFGPLASLQVSLRNGDFYAAKEILEGMAPPGTTYQQIAEGIAAAHKGASPSEVAYRRKLRELADKETKDAEAAQTAAQAAQAATEETARTERNRAGAEKLLKGTSFDGLPGAADALIKLAADNWDPVKKGLKVPAAQLVKLLAKDPVIGQLAELKRLKGKPVVAPVVTPPAVVRNRKGRFEATKPADKKAAAEVERQAAIAEAARMEHAANRSARKGAR